VTSGLAAIPAIRRHPRARRRADAGFTLIEIILVIGLLALVSALFVGGASDWLRARERTPEDVFWQAVSEARQLALRRDETVVFRYDEKSRALRWGEGEAAGAAAWPGRAVELLPAQETSAVLLGGSLVETGRLTEVRFHPDGSCDPFRAMLTEADGRRRTLTLDPWTCAPMLPATPRP
jgi:prepilin-type N-terminal cleavage/methylation domain-containing protein